MGIIIGKTRTVTAIKEGALSGENRSLSTIKP